MNICFVAPRIVSHGVQGGMNVVSDLLVKQLAKMGHTVRVITSRHPTLVHETPMGNLEIHYHPPLHRTEFYGRKGWLLCDLFHQLNQNEFDVILGESFAAWALVRDQNINVPVVSMLHGSGFVGMQSTWNLIRNGEPCWGLFLRHFASSLRRFFGVQLPVMQQSRQVIAISQEIKEDLLRFYRVPKGRVSIVHNGVDPQLFKPDQDRRQRIRSRLGISPNTRVFITVGTLNAEKGQMRAVKMFEETRLNNVSLIIVGGGPDAEILRTRIGQSPIRNRIFFIGRARNQELPDYYCAADIFMLPTYRVEGFPVTITEALNCGLPVITYDVGGNRSAVVNGVDGFLVTLGNHQDFVARLETLGGNASLCEEFSRNALCRANKELTVELMATKTLQVLEEVIDGRRESPHN